MVQLFYYESRGQECESIIRHDGSPLKVTLHAFEGWAQPALCTHWLIKFHWWTTARCKIVQVSGSKQVTTGGKVTFHADGSMFVTGKFKKSYTSFIPLCLAPNNSTSGSTSCGIGGGGSGFIFQRPAGLSARVGDLNSSGVRRIPPSHFCLYLTTRVSEADFHLGYCMTGTLQRGNKKKNQWEMTHYAMVKRRGY